MQAIGGATRVAQIALVIEYKDYRAPMEESSCLYPCLRALFPRYPPHFEIALMSLLVQFAAHCHYFQLTGYVPYHIPTIF